LIQLADVAPLASPRTHAAEPYFPEETPLHLPYRERMRVYSTGWFDLGFFALLFLMMCAALFA
jgi:hypothetical protein